MHFLDEWEKCNDDIRYKILAFLSNNTTRLVHISPHIEDHRTITNKFNPNPYEMFWQKTLRHTKWLAASCSCYFPKHRGFTVQRDTAFSLFTTVTLQAPNTRAWLRKTSSTTDWACFRPKSLISRSTYDCVRSIHWQNTNQRLSLKHIFQWIDCGTRSRFSLSHFLRVLKQSFDSRATNNI